MTVSNGKSIALVLSELMLNVMGSRKEHGNPEIHSKQLNDELDRHYHEALAALEEIMVAAKPPTIDTSSRIKLYADDEGQMWYDRGQNDAIERYEQNLKQSLANSK